MNCKECKRIASIRVNGENYCPNHASRQAIKLIMEKKINAKK